MIAIIIISNIIVFIIFFVEITMYFLIIIIRITSDRIHYILFSFNRNIKNNIIGYYFLIFHVKSI